MSNSIDTNTLLVQLRAMAQDAGIPASEAQPTAASEDAVDFSRVLEATLDQVSARSSEASKLRQSYESGNPNVELADVMIAAQKARISFEALSQVRNKMVAAYKEVMSMPL